MKEAELCGRCHQHQLKNVKNVFYDAICAMIVVTAIPVANAKARAIPTKIFFMIVLNPFGQRMNDKIEPSDLN